MSKIQKCTLFVVLVLFSIIGILFGFNVISEVNAYTDSSLPFVEQVYSSDNLGYSTFGFSNSSPKNFGDLSIRPNYDNTFLSFMCRAGLVVSSVRGLNDIIGYDFSPMLQVRNEYYCLSFTNGYKLQGSSDDFNGGFNYATNNYTSLLLNHSSYNNSLLCSMFIPVQLYNYSSVDTNINSLCYFAMRFDNSQDISNYRLISDVASFDIVSVEIGNSLNWSYGDAYGSSLIAGSNYRFNYVIYRSALGSSYLFAFGCSTDVNTIYLWDDRNYYLNNDVNVNLPSYDSGYNRGFNDGKSVGYNLGLTDGSDYSFLSLIGAVVDAPLNVFKSLFNFEILGFNLLAFITGLITLAIIIWIVKLIL